MTNVTAPDRAEAAEYYFNYIDQVPDGDIWEILQAQLPETLALLHGISEGNRCIDMPVRLATVSLFEHLPADAWDRRGIASGNPFTVRALAYLAAGHVTHHLILRERYL